MERGTKNDTKTDTMTSKESEKGDRVSMCLGGRERLRQIDIRTQRGEIRLCVYVEIEEKERVRL